MIIFLLDYNGNINNEMLVFSLFDIRDKTKISLALYSPCVFFLLGQEVEKKSESLSWLFKRSIPPVLTAFNILYDYT